MIEMRTKMEMTQSRKMHRKKKKSLSSIKKIRKIEK